MMTRLAALLSLILAACPLRAGDRAAEELFESKVRPVLAERCFACHGEKKQASGLRLDSRDAILKGGDNGPAATPGKPDESRIIEAVRQAGELKMPPKGEKLADEQIAALAEWVQLGLPWPADAAKAADAAHSHWAFRPVNESPPPPVHDPGWVRNPIDAFVLAKLEANGLRPNPPADRRTFLRRVTIDLTGLPPTPEEVEA